MDTNACPLCGVNVEHLLELCVSKRKIKDKIAELHSHHMSSYDSHIAKVLKELLE